jgi:hypothetical protein
LDTKLYWTAKLKDFHNQLLHGERLQVRKYMIYADENDLFCEYQRKLCVLAAFQRVYDFVEHIGLWRWNI